MARGPLPLNRLTRRGRHVVEGHPILRNYFNDRCPHLAAMVAYYALLSLVPLVFLSLSLLTLGGTPTEGSSLVQALHRIAPGSSVDSVVSVVTVLQRNSTELGLIGGIGLMWSSLGFVSALESAVNIVYQVPNRRFVRQKLLAFLSMASGLVAVFLSLIASTTAHAFIANHAPVLSSYGVWRVGVTLLGSTAVTFAFLLIVYRSLPNTPITAHEVLPGTIIITILFQASFEALPLYLRFASLLPALKAFGGAVVLLVWLYLMGNILLLGVEINWWNGRGRAIAQTPPLEEGLGHA